MTEGYERWVLNREDTIEGYTNSGYTYCEDGDEDDEMNDGDSDGLSKHSHQITQAEVQKLKVSFLSSPKTLHDLNTNKGTAKIIGPLEVQKHKAR